MRCRGFHRKLIVDLDIHGDYPETPLSHGIWAMLKPARDRFYLLALDLQNILNGVTTGKLKLRRLRITFESHSLGWAQAWELRSLVRAIRAAGVETHAYLLSDSRVSLYIATACERVVAPESSGFDLTPFTSETVFLQSLLTKLGVRPQFLSVGDFKSAAEIFTRKGFSPESRKQTEELIGDLESQFWQAIGEKTTKLTRNKHRGLYSATAAQRENLIDEICSYTEFCEQSGDAKKWHEVDVYRATQILRRRTFALTAFRRRKKIALLVAEGNIIESHESRPGTINWHDYRDVAGFLKREQIDGAVLRVNSPGGSALVSQLLWREWMLAIGRNKTQETENKQVPLYVSQGNVAASGGYYLSAAGEKIFSAPTTVTGSIGVVGGKFNVSPLLQKWGVSIDRAPKGNPSPVFSAFSDFSTADRKTISATMQDIYEQFVRDVAVGRNTKTDAIKPLASGRVYSGDRALKNGLADQSGGLTQALTALKSELKIKATDPIDLIILPGVKEPLFSRSMLPLGLSRALQIADLARPGVYTVETRCL
jgi:protease-4